MRVPNLLKMIIVFSGGLHGVGVSVVNALIKTSRSLGDVVVDQVYYMTFENGEPTSKLKVIEKIDKNKSGTTVKFYPNPEYFDSPKILAKPLKHLLRAKAVLCPGLRVRFEDKQSGEVDEWHYEAGLKAYLVEQIGKAECLPEEPFEGTFEATDENVEFCCCLDSRQN